ncbi:unnamed protein product, partial [Sphagnum balticum]
MRRLGTIAATAVRLVAFWVVAFTVCCSNKYIVRCVDTMSPPADCSIQFNQLAPCLPFVIGDAAAPSDACCKAIGDVASKSAVCLCMLVNSPLSPSTSPGDGGGGFNVTLAFMLPSLCKVPADSSQCRSVISSESIRNDPWKHAHLEGEVQESYPVNPLEDCC